MSITHLPSELLDAISSFAAPTDVATLAQTASWLCPVAQRILYRHVHISSDNLDVVTTLANKPYVARFVRTFTIDADQDLDLYHTLSVALAQMSELTHLDLSVDSGASWILDRSHSTLFPRLQSFASPFPLDESVINFLSNTEALLQLTIDKSSTLSPLPVPTLPRTSLPHLSQFTGSAHAAQAIVPGRPIQNIQLYAGDLTESVVCHLAQSTAHVLMLSATTSFLPVPLLGLLAHHMPHLVYLHTMTTYHFSGPPDVSFYQDVANVLSSLPDLQAFELCGMHWGSSRKADNDERVWQSKPLTPDLPLADLDPLNDQDQFYAY
ncbi:hypothetical protein BD779DRAFT_1490075 [Infundibulicybe gibba]|nr:hypothetical protein BD779DRAFT_1490075 [Infundibulicybe gibba]